jgi:hypothetical protein
MWWAFQLKKGTQSDIHGEYKLLECVVKIAV